MEALIRDGDRVAGIRGHNRTGAAVEERARVVIAADGVHSLVAKAVQAPEYDCKPALTTNYYSYFSGFPAADLEFYVRDYHAVGCFPTHDGLTLIAVLWPSSRFEEIRSDIDSHVQQAVKLTPGVEQRLKNARREAKWAGTAGVPNYFRQPYGPGWALVGDAGYDRDPISAQGISDAFIDADALSRALDDSWLERRPLDSALREYHSKRDRRAKPMYDFTCEMARLEPPPPHMQQLFAALHGNQDATNQFFSALSGSIPLPAFMNPENVQRIVATAGGRS